MDFQVKQPVTTVDAPSPAFHQSMSSFHNTTSALYMERGDVVSALLAINNYLFYTIYTPEEKGRKRRGEGWREKEIEIFKSFSICLQSCQF